MSASPWKKTSIPCLAAWSPALDFSPTSHTVQSQHRAERSGKQRLLAARRRKARHQGTGTALLISLRPAAALRCPARSAASVPPPHSSVSAAGSAAIRARRPGAEVFLAHRGIRVTGLESVRAKHEWCGASPSLNGSSPPSGWAHARHELLI